MLFSQPAVAAFLSNSFECVWESVRPVPRVTVDFGNGHRLERTLRGNIATYVCTGAGETIDLIPGLVDGREYVSRLGQSLALFAEVRPGASAVSRRELVAEWHRGLSVIPADARPVPAARDLAKATVELRIERRLSPPPPGLAEAASSPADADDSGLALDTRFAREHG